MALVFQVLGFAFLVAGAGAIYLPLGFLMAGAILFVSGGFEGRRGPDRRP